MRSVVLFYVCILSSLSFVYSDLNASTTNFSVELLHYTLQQSDQSVVISPYAIWSLLASIAYDTSGVTREQISKVLLLTEDRDEFVREFHEMKTTIFQQVGITVSVLNLLYYDEKFNADGISRLQNDFEFDVQRLNFEKPQQTLYTILNRYRKYQKPIMLVQNLKREDFNATMIMCNFVHFIANWSKKLNWNKYNDNNVPKIRMKAQLSSLNIEELHASITDLPYEGGKYSMLLIKPQSGYDIKQVSASLREVSLPKIVNDLQRQSNNFEQTEVEIELPKQVTSTVILNSPLSNMGLSNLFDRYNANFNDFTEDDMYIGEISQGANIYFTKSDTTAEIYIPASVSTEFAYRQSEGRISANDSFIFLIMHKYTATILFCGSYS